MRDAVDDWAAEVTSWRQDPVEFAERVLGLELWNGQRRIAPCLSRAHGALVGQAPRRDRGREFKSHYLRVPKSPSSEIHPDSHAALAVSARRLRRP